MLGKKSVYLEFRVSFAHKKINLLLLFLLITKIERKNIINYLFSRNPIYDDFDHFWKFEEKNRILKTSQFLLSINWKEVSVEHLNVLGLVFVQQ